jgi:ATP-dependent RNA helicase RhlE
MALFVDGRSYGLPGLTSFADLGLAPPILKAVEDMGYTEPTPIQAQAIPVVLSGRDLMGGAQTGTGKTAGFTLPLLQKMLPHANTSTSPARHPIRALILAPTRELAAQVEESVRNYSKYLALRSTQVYGGVNMDPQIAELRRGVEIVVATPGRLLDHVQQKTINLSRVEFFVLDEADRMLDMGFIPDIRRIIALIPKERQSLLFSATFPEDIKRLAGELLRDPVSIQVARRNAVAESVTHVVHPVDRQHKRELLVHLVKSRGLHQVLVFTATRIGCNRLAFELNREGVHAAAIHGDKTQSERTEALEQFKTGKVGVLVATDVAARGIDIDSLPCVINFELPNTPEDYVHRIGRTGRAGKEGEAISLVAPEEHEKLADIEKVIKAAIRREPVAGFNPGVSTSHDGERVERTGERGHRGARGASRDRTERVEVPERSARPERAERAERSERDRPRERDERRRPARPEAVRGEVSQAQLPVSDDPIFTRPYEPADLPAEVPDSVPVADGGPAAPGRRTHPVAALLGGLFRRNR